jgi:predicted metalloendopeptidase
VSRFFPLHENVLILFEQQHAFDSAGRLYNQEGKLEEWWTDATSERFMEKQSCLEKQYSGALHLFC